MSCQDVTPHSFSSLSENEKRDAELDNGKSSEPRGHGHPWGTGLEAVQEAAVDVAQGAHAAGASGLAALGLLTPVDYKKKSS